MATGYTIRTEAREQDGTTRTQTVSGASAGFVAGYLMSCAHNMNEEHAELVTLTITTEGEALAYPEVGMLERGRGGA